jgi:hypothetical protein
MGFLTPDTTDQNDALATFAGHQVLQVATTLHGLTTEQLAATPVDGAPSLGALARHVIIIAGGISAAIGGEGPGPRTPEQAAAEGGLELSALRAEDTPEALTQELEDVASNLVEAIRAADPEAEMPIPDEPWFAPAKYWNVRWRSLHAVEEFARHAGHADVIRQAIDGKTAYELNARYDGEEWPPAGW